MIHSEVAKSTSIIADRLFKQPLPPYPVYADFCLSNLHYRMQLEDGTYFVASLP